MLEQLLKLLQGRLQGNIHQVLSWPFWTVWVLGNPPPLSSRVGHAELDRLCLIGKKIEKRKSKNIFTRANTTAPTEPLAIFLTLSSSRCSWSHVPSESLFCWTWSYCWGPGLLCCSANPPFTSVLCSTVGQWHGKSTQGLCPKKLWHLFSFLCRPWTEELGYGGFLVPRKTRLLEIFPTWLQQFCSSWFYSFILQLGKTTWKFKKLPIGTGFTAPVYQPMPAIAFQKTLRGTGELWTQIPREALIFVLLYIHNQAYEEMLPTTNIRLECHNISSYSLDCHSTFCKTNMLIIFFLNDDSATKLARSSLLDICKRAVCEPVPPPEMVHRKSLGHYFIAP